MTYELLEKLFIKESDLRSVTEPIFEWGKFKSKGEWSFEEEILMTEPDGLYWVDDETLFPCAIVRGSFGHWCGYVGVPTSTNRVTGLLTGIPLQDDTLPGLYIDYQDDAVPFEIASVEHNSPTLFWYGFVLDQYSPAGAYALQKLIDEAPDSKLKTFAKEFVLGAMDPDQYEDAITAVSSVLRLANHLSKEYAEWPRL